MDTGILAARGTPIPNPLPISWLGLISAPLPPPAWAKIGNLSSIEIRNLQAQIGYNQSNWNYNLIGNNNELGRYQFETTLLESYGLLAPGSNIAHGTYCINYRNCWRPTYINSGQNTYTNYFYNVSSAIEFLNSIPSQDHLAYQYMSDLYVKLTDNKSIVPADTNDIVAGMIYVGWILGVSGAYQWRYNNTGSGAIPFASGRYSIVVLSQ